MNKIAEKCGPSKEDNASLRIKQVSNYLRSAGEDDLKTSQPLISPYDSEGMLGLLSSYMSNNHNSSKRYSSCNPAPPVTQLRTVLN